MKETSPLNVLLPVYKHVVIRFYNAIHQSTMVQFLRSDGEKMLTIIINCWKQTLALHYGQKRLPSWLQAEQELLHLIG